MKPKFSIIVTIYNMPRDYVKKCIDSIITQSYSNWECIVIDDCSNIKYDDLFNDSRITYIKLEKNRGVFAAYKYGFQHSTGDYIIHCDSDDWLATNYLQKVMELHPPKKRFLPKESIVYRFTRFLALKIYTGLLIHNQVKGE